MKTIRSSLIALAAVVSIVGLAACGDGQQVLNKNQTLVYDRDGSVDARQVFAACQGRPVLGQQKLADNSDGQSFIVTCGPAR